MHESEMEVFYAMYGDDCHLLPLQILLGRKKLENKK